MPRSFARPIIIAAALLVALPLALAQGTAADYARATGLRAKFEGLALHVPGAAHWIPDTSDFWYHRTVAGGREFILVHAATLAKAPAFDHARLAAALTAASGHTYTGVTLPFIDPPQNSATQPIGQRESGVGGLRFVDHESAITFGLDQHTWRCDLADYQCQRGDALPAPRRGYADPDPAPFDPAAGPLMTDNTAADGLETLIPEVTAPESAEPPQARPPADPQARSGPQFIPSPDGRLEAYIRNFNVFLRAVGAKQGTPLSFDGSEGNYYSLRSLAWSPNSRYLAAYATRPGYSRHIQYVESSPDTQVQPISFQGPQYAKPGDTLPIAHPALFDVATQHETPIANTLFPNPFDLTRPVWWQDSRGFTFEYNQRGHQIYRVIQVDAPSGTAHTLIEESSPTFIDYRPLIANPSDTGKRFRSDINDGHEIIWASERDGWEHLYLYNGLTGKVENQINHGDWPVRAVDYVDPERRQIWFEASGTIAGQDPYYIHYYRVNFDGTGLTAFTSANGTHSVQFSPDHRFYVDSWSRVDAAPVSELRRTSDQKTLLPLETGDLAPLLAAGWQPPVIFHAPGRDGHTEIWGVIYRPTNFEAGRKYPVVESIYAGPQGNFAPKAFSGGVQPLAELGFAVAQMDGMGTNNRSRAFHDVAWKNLKDAGFPDRILWHRAAAQRFPWYDISRGVGIYGTSAGGQSALGALLFHPGFYTVAVSNSGCHDNRMDKIWWNEQWMGWPVGPQYADNSNVDNAWRLRGKLLLVFGELDNNVDPASTLQVVNQLIRHHKRFDLLEVPGGGHGAGGAYYQHLLQDFFVHNLLHVEPPVWNTEPE